MEKKRYNPGAASKRTRRVADQTSGIRWVKLDTFVDVKLACNAFLRDRISRGLMKEWKYGAYSLDLQGEKVSVVKHPPMTDKQ